MMPKIGLLALFIFLSGCASVKTTTTIYHTDDFSPQGKTYAYAPQANQNNLQFEYITGLVTAELQKYNFMQNPATPDYTITLKYGTGQPQYRQVQAPVYGQTGYIGPFWPGPAYGAYGAMYYPPSYGVVGTMPVTVTRYAHYFDLNIYPAKNVTALVNARPVYTLQAQTLSATDNLALVLPAMIRAAFSEFDARSGTLFSKSIPINSQTGAPRGR